MGHIDRRTHMQAVAYAHARAACFVCQAATCLRTPGLLLLGASSLDDGYRCRIISVFSSLLVACASNSNRIMS